MVNDGSKAVKPNLTSVKVEDVSVSTSENNTQRKNDVSWGENPSCFSQLFFLWLVPLLRKGTKSDLTYEDLGKVTNLDDPKRAYERFQRLWEEEKLSNDASRKTNPRETNIKSVFINFVGKRKLAFCFFLASCSAIFTTLVPFVSRELIESYALSEEIDSREKSLYVCAIAFLPLFAAICNGHLQFISKRTSAHLYAAFTMAIYNKAIRMNAASSSFSSTGQVVNIMSSDAGASMERAIFMLFPIVIAPIQLGVVIYLLWDLLDNALIAGCILMVIVFPLNAAIFIKMGHAFKAVMGKTDARMQLLNEMLSAIRIIKSYAWEEPFMKNLILKRKEELKQIRRHSILFTVGISAMFLQLPLLLQVATLSSFYLLGGLFLPSTVFTALQLFGILQQQLTQIPSALAQLVQTNVSLKRIGAFLDLPEIEYDDTDTVKLFDRCDTSSGDVVVKIVNGVFSWNPNQMEEVECEVNESASFSNVSNKNNDSAVDGQDDSVVLQNINLELKLGEKVAVFGSVGVGKSSLLMALLGELQKRQGTMFINSSVAFASQKPWVVHATLRENILFGKDYDEKRYNKVIHVCALDDDLKVLAHGDKTVIGERGINLSGGQKARVSLARAVYSDASTLLLDDPLAAVDAHVGKHIFEKCIHSDLTKDKLVVLVTNQANLLNRFERVVVMSKKTIIGNGSVNQLLEQGICLNAYSVTGHKDVDKSISEDPEDKNATSENVNLQPKETKGETKIEEDNLYEEEHHEIGAVKFEIYKYYFRTTGYTMVVFSVIFYALFFLSRVFADYSLTFWTNEAVCMLMYPLAMTTAVEDPCNPRGEDFWLAVYIGLIACGFVCCFAGACIVAEARVNAARRMHSKLLITVFNAPMSYFDTTPVGRILNRFSKDIGIIDMQLTTFVLFTGITLLSSITGFLAIGLGTDGMFLIAIIPIGIIYLRLFSLARRSAIRLQRLEAVTKSPLYSNFSELLTGLPTVRAYNQSIRFAKKNEEAIRKNIVPFFLARTAYPSYLTIAINMIGMLISGTVAAIVVGSNRLSGSQVGFALTSSLAISQTLMYTVFMLTEMETLMNSVERIKEYSEEIESEAPSYIDSDAELSDWPSKGGLQVKQLTIGYRDGVNVLKGISFEVHPREKIGIVGRTGSGKSTLMLALLRMVEARSGNILLDGVDISNVGLQTLRHSVGIIPQDPVCFIGTIRYNLDPFNTRDDAQLWEYLRKVQLYDFVQGLPEKLSFQINESGENISVGQRQLLNIARALVRDTKLLMLDEATSSVDKETDKLLQHTIRQSFADRTVLTIAHRLETILDSDRVLVLSDGNILQYDTPGNLLKQDGVFKSMVQASNH